MLIMFVLMRRVIHVNKLEEDAVLLNLRHLLSLSFYYVNLMVSCVEEPEAAGLVLRFKCCIPINLSNQELSDELFCLLPRLYGGRWRLKVQLWSHGWRSSGFSFILPLCLPSLFWPLEQPNLKLLFEINGLLILAKSVDRPPKFLITWVIAHFAWAMMM